MYLLSAFLLALLLPVAINLLAPFTAGFFGLAPLEQVGRSVLAANLGYIPGLLLLTWSFQVAPQVAGPAANVGSVLGVTLVTCLMAGKRPSLEVALAMACIIISAIWLYYALERVPARA